MTSAEQVAYRPRLEALAADLRAQLAQENPTKDSIAPDNAIGRLTRMEAIQAQSMGAATRQRQAARLKQVERALRFIDERRYGTCVGCGKPIETGRLEIMPESLACVTCASRRS